MRPLVYRFLIEVLSLGSRILCIDFKFVKIMPKPSCHGVGSLFEGHLLWVFLAGKIDLALAA